MTKKTKVFEFLAEIKKEGWLDDYCLNVGTTTSYMERMLKHGLYYPKMETRQNMFKYSRRRLRKKDIESHFKGVQKRCEEENRIKRINKKAREITARG